MGLIGKKCFGVMTLSFVLLSGCIPYVETPNQVEPVSYPNPELHPIGPGGPELQAITKLTNATKHDYAHPHVSYDGKWLAYSATINRSQPDIYVQPLDGFTARQLTNGYGSNVHPAISPDSKQVAFASNREGKYRIYVVSLNGQGGLEEIGDASSESISPTWSPDGNRIAYATRQNVDSPWKIAIHDRLSGHVTYLTYGIFPDWSPFGEHIVFQRNSYHAPGYSSIFTIRSDGTELTELYHSDEHGAITPAWGARGEWVLFATVNKSTASQTRNNLVYFNADDVWMIKRDGTQARVSTSHRLADWDPCYDVQNRRIIYVSNRDGVQNIFSMQANMSLSKKSPEGLFTRVQE